jgi:hypothetical protein
MKFSVLVSTSCLWFYQAAGLFEFARGSLQMPNDRSQMTNLGIPPLHICHLQSVIWHTDELQANPPG